MATAIVYWGNIRVLGFRDLRGLWGFGLYDAEGFTGSGFGSLGLMFQGFGCLGIWGLGFIV